MFFENVGFRVRYGYTGCFRMSVNNREMISNVMFEIGYRCNTYETETMNR